MRRPLLRAILGRLAVGLATLVAASMVVFLAMEALPGDAAEAAQGQLRDPAALSAFREEFDLERPLLERYTSWVQDLAHGDLGRSMPSGEPVTELLGDRIRNTAALALLTVLVLIPVSVFLGVASAVKKDGWLDHLVASSTLSFISMPEFVIGSLLALILAVWLGALPAVSLLDSTAPITSQMTLLVLPVLTLVVSSVAQTTRMIRASMIDVLRQNYIEAARLRGVPNQRILWRHALPNALGASVQVIAINVAILAGGVVIVERVFQYPGLGEALIGAVAGRDFPTVQALAMMITALYIVINITADILVVLLNPRLRRARA